MSGDDLEVRVMNHDLLRLLAGNELTLETTGGTRVKVRLYTADELLAVQHAAVKGGEGEPMGREQADDLTRPIPFESLLGRSS